MSSLINHTYEEDASTGKMTFLSSSDNEYLGVNVSVSDLGNTDHTTGGIWKFVEIYDSNLTSPQGDIISTKEDSNTTFFNKFVSGYAMDFVNAIFPSLTTAEKTSYINLFGGTSKTTKINIWYNQSCPLINIISYNLNNINTALLKNSADVENVRQTFSIGLFAYPKIAFKTSNVGAASRSFNQNQITDSSLNKLIDLKVTNSIEFNGTWYDAPGETVSINKWVSEVKKWTNMHNRSILSEDVKNSTSYVMNAVNKYDFGSLSYRMICDQITDLNSLFFTI